MDRRLKERLVGASIVVVLVVLIVPELLSGPKPPATAAEVAPPGPTELHTVTVDMATSKALPADEPAPAAAQSDADAEDPTARAAPGKPSTVAPPASIVTLQAQPQQPDAAEVEKAPPPTVATKAGSVHDTPSTDGAHPNWSVQLGSFASRVNAEKLQRNLKAKHFAAFVSSGGTGRSLRYRVRVGPLADRAAADKVIARLKKEGHAASVVAP